MRKILIFSVLLALSFKTAPADANVLFGEKTNQFTLYGGYALGNTDLENYNFFTMAQYSQPMRLFRLDGRMNLHLGHVNSSSYPWTVAGGSADVVLLSYRNFWAGVGIGAFIRDRYTPRLDSSFTFGERAFVGHNINKRINVELFVQHFSNGDLTQNNLGYNFWGLAVGVNF
ncbi:MAG: acyloxyacyl hydrolase [Alphaproteobacteria bacterium]|nr:acyloxyacyl hydrolase [Alphaproteobacteria bacterium]MCL2758288.1 acyloxyacyl hydrolase [Alphaproteobacteria bacterium]